MKAIYNERYGPLEALRLQDLERPTIGATDVLVRVRAAGLHIGDCFAVRGAPWGMRVATGLLKPKNGVPGFDVAGVVETVGSGVTRFKLGNEVFGACEGSCAEFAAVSQDTLALKPANLSFEEAAALPTSALAALHGLRDAAKVQPGQKVLINGASGGIGTFAVQIAKSMGAHVTGVCGTTNIDLVRSLGADDVIDYAQEDFTLRGPVYDVILDNIENRSLSDIRRALTPKGTLLCNSGTGATGPAMLIRLAKPIVISPFVGHNLRRYLSTPKHDDLVVLKDLVESGKVRPLIDRTFPLSETVAALQYIDQGHARGKVVVAV